MVLGPRRQGATIDGMDLAAGGATLFPDACELGFCRDPREARHAPVALYKHPISIARRYTAVVEAKHPPLRDQREEVPMRLRTALCSAVSALCPHWRCSARAAAASTTSSSGGKPLVGVDYPRSDTDFWNSYIKYMPQYAKELGINLKTTNSQNDVAKLVANAQAFISQGVKAVVDGPAGHRRHRAHPRRSWRRRRSRSSPSTPAPTRARSTWSSAPTTGRTASKACQFLGDQARRQGQGRRAPGRPGLHQRPRPLRGVRRVHEEEVPRHQGVRGGHRLGGRRGRRQAADRLLAQHPDIKGIYMQAGVRAVRHRSRC